MGTVGEAILYRSSHDRHGLEPSELMRPQPINAWESRFDERQSAAVNAAHALSDDALDSASVEILTLAVLDEHCAGLVEPAWDRIHLNTREPLRLRVEPVVTTVQPLEVELVMPCRGAGSLLMSRTPAVVTGTQAHNNGFDLLYTLSLEFKDDAGTQEQFAEGLQSLLGQWKDRVAEALPEVNEQIAAAREDAREVVEPIVRGRHHRRTLFRSATDALNIPLNRRPGTPAQLRLDSRPVTLAAVEASAAAGGNEAALADDIADDLIDLIRSFGNALERLPVTANKLLEADEESIRDVLLFILNANWRGAVTGESFLGRGKTDILLRWRDRDAFIGECKRWRGPAAFVDGVEQLLDRYTIWRATRVAMVVFIQGVADVSAVIGKATDALSSHARCLQRLDAADAEHVRFVMSAQHDKDKIVTIELIPVVIPSPEADTVKTA